MRHFRVLSHTHIHNGARIHTQSFQPRGKQTTEKTEKQMNSRREEGVDDGRLESVGGWREWEERYSRGASITTDLCLFLFRKPPLHPLPSPAPSLSWDNARARNPWHWLAPATQFHGSFFSISRPHWSITARLPRWSRWRGVWRKEGGGWWCSVMICFH